MAAAGLQPWGPLRTKRWQAGETTGRYASRKGARRVSRSAPRDRMPRVHSASARNTRSARYRPRRVGTVLQARPPRRGFEHPALASRCFQPFRDVDLLPAPLDGLFGHMESEGLRSAACSPSRSRVIWSCRKVVAHDSVPRGFCIPVARKRRLLADSTRSRTSASRILIRPQTNVGNRRPSVNPEAALDENSQRGTR